jgi:transposase
MAKVVPNVRRRTLQPLIEGSVAPGSTVHGDEPGPYNGPLAKGYDHQTVNHGAEEFARDGCHVNTIEGYRARLKLSIRGTHVHVSGKHLQKDVGQFEYRYNSR